MVLIVLILIVLILIVKLSVLVLIVTLIIEAVIIFLIRLILLIIIVSIRFLIAEKRTLLKTRLRIVAFINVEFILIALCKFELLNSFLHAHSFGFIVLLILLAIIQVFQYFVNNNFIL